MQYFLSFRWAICDTGHNLHCTLNNPA